MNQPATPVAIARAFTEAWSSHDMETAASYLADDVVFDGPGGHSTGTEAYLQGLSRFAQSVTSLKILAAHGDAAEAVIMYEVTTAQPGTLSCAELLTFRDGKIQTDRLTFAPTKPATD